MFKINDRVQHVSKPYPIGTVVNATCSFGIHSPHTSVSVNTKPLIKVIWDEDRFNKRIDFNKPMKDKFLELYLEEDC